MAEKYLTEDNFKNILAGIEAKIPKELEVSINTNVNRTAIVLKILLVSFIIILPLFFSYHSVIQHRNLPNIPKSDVQNQYVGSVTLLY